MAISLKHSDDHFFQTGDDEITLSSKLRSIHVPSGVAAQRPYGTLDFDRLIKQNPFENDIKLTQNKSPLNSPSKQNASPGLQYDKNKDLTFGNNSTLSANNSDGLPQSPTKDGKNRKISDMAAEEDKEKNKSVDGSERYEDLENNFRTFPNGILKIGEKSRYSREFDEPKLTTSGSSKNIRAQNPREVYQQSNFSKNK